MKNKYSVFYTTSLFIIIMASVYPIYMGISVFMQYLKIGFVETANYPKYIIPYTPMCIAIIVCALLLPFLYKLFKRYSVLVLSTLGIMLFIVGELFFEQIKVLEGYKTVPLESWQLSLCIATPEVLMAIGEPIYAENNPAFKVHFYLIAIVIILIVVGILYGFTRMFKENLHEKKRPLIMQTVSVIIFIALCILACFTAFFRNGTLYISPLSAFLTGLFFVVFGVAFGLYIAGYLFGKRKLLSVFVPAIVASLTTLIMYIGELVLMDGELFIFGKGFFFEPLFKSPAFSFCDIMIIILSGIITPLLTYLLNLSFITTKKDCP